MIRFMADTWQDAVLRPIAMVAPNGWVYTEIMAPDFRFAFALGISAAVLITLVTRKQKIDGHRSIFILLGLTLLSFALWMATTGNGRYFMPYLILIGPLCLGLIRILPSTRSMKASLAILLMGIQGFALYQNNPWKPFDSWQSIPWKEAPYFSLDIDLHAIDTNATYVSVSNMSLSLIAPQFPPSSRWVNLSQFNGSDVSRDSSLYEPIRRIFQSSSSLKIIQRSAPREMALGTEQPNQKAIEAINLYLHPHRLALKEPTDCNFLASKSLATSTFIGTDESTQEKERIKSKAGFWICTLQYPVAAPALKKLTNEGLIAKQVFERMETLCPRFFTPGQELVGGDSGGYVRSYGTSDSSLIVTRDGNLYFQYARALNPQRIGMVNEVLSPGYIMDCNKFKGRSGLPWEREI